MCTWIYWHKHHSKSHNPIEIICQTCYCCVLSLSLPCDKSEEEDCQNIGHAEAVFYNWVPWVYSNSHLFCDTTDGKVPQSWLRFTKSKPCSWDQQQQPSRQVQADTTFNIYIVPFSFAMVQPKMLWLQASFKWTLLDSFKWCNYRCSGSVVCPIFVPTTFLIIFLFLWYFSMILKIQYL